MSQAPYDEAALQRGLAFARAVAVLFLLVGLLDAASVLQTLLIAIQYPSVMCGEAIFAALTVAQLFLGSRIYDASIVATVLGALVAAFATLWSVGWFVFLLVGGAFAILPVFVAGGSLFCSVAALVFIPVARQVSHQRSLLLEGL
ncbi:MAG: hypothetical protein ABMA64_03420 [Myxococcota bacterium]